MRKIVYLIRGTKDESYPLFSDRVLAFAISLSTEKEIKQVKISYTKSAPPRFSVIPFRKEKIAAISIYFSETAGNGPVLNDSGISEAYLVDEVIPVAYNKNWPDLTPSPGICLLTLFRRKEGIVYPTFLDRWHNGHTPLSLKIHPLWNYNRNVVKEDINGSESKLDGIVEEHFRRITDLTNPVKFFGNPFVMVFNMIRVYADTRSFIEYKSIEPYYATEMYIRS